MGIIVPSNIDPTVRVVLEEVSRAVARLEKQVSTSVSGPSYTGGAPTASSGKIPDGDVTIRGNLKVQKDLTVDGRIRGDLEYLTSYDEEYKMEWATGASIGTISYEGVESVEHKGWDSTSPFLVGHIAKGNKVSISSNATPFEGLRIVKRDGKGAIYIGGKEASPSKMGVVSYESSSDRFVGRFKSRHLPFCGAIVNDLTIKVPTDFPTIYDAIDYLRDKFVPDTVEVTVLLEAGTHNITTNIEWNHPCCQRIQFSGADPVTNTFTSIVSVTGSAGAWYVTLQLGESPVVSVNDYVSITYASGGTNANYLVGCWLVTSVDTGNNRITILSRNRNATYTPSGSVTGTLACYKTYLVLSGGATRVFSNSSVVIRARYFTFVGSGSGIAIYASSGRINVESCGFSNFADCLYLDSMAFARVQNCALSPANSADGIELVYGAGCLMRGQSCIAGGARSIFAWDACMVILLDTIITGSGSYGLRLLRGSYGALRTNSVIDGCYIGVSLQTTSSVFITGSTGAINSTSKNYEPQMYRCAQQFSYITAGSPGYGDGVDAMYVGNVRVTRAGNLNDNTPAAPTDTANIDWLTSASNPTQISAHIHFNEIDHNKTMNYVKLKHKNHASIYMRGRYSIYGGGNISASRQFYLKNDVENPGGWTYYGTNASGIKGWLQASSLVRRFAATGGGGGGGGDGDKVLINSVRVTNAANFVDGAASGGKAYVKWLSSGASPTTIKGYVFASYIDHNKLKNRSATKHKDHTLVYLRGNKTITGGGNLAASRYFSLVNDAESPGAWKVYGTNASGVKRWRAETDTLLYILAMQIFNNVQFLVAEKTSYLGNEKKIIGTRGVETQKTNATFFIRKALPKTFFEIYRDFTYVTSGSNDNFTTFASSGSVTTVTAAVPGHPGVARFSTGTSSSGYSGIRTDANAFWLGSGSNLKYIFETCVYMPVSSTSTQRFCFMAGWLGQTNNTLNGANINYLCFRYSDNMNSGKFEAYLRNTRIHSNATIKKNTGVKFASLTWYTLRIEVDDYNGKADFYIDNTKVATIYRKIKPVTAASSLKNIQAELLMFKRVGTTTRYIHSDYIYLTGEYGTTRRA